MNLGVSCFGRCPGFTAPNIPNGALNSSTENHRENLHADESKMMSPEEVRPSDFEIYAR